MKRCVTCNKQFTDDGTFCPFDGGNLELITEDPLIGATLDGKYRIDSRISQGGMGTVYRATHVLMDHVCAVKVLHDSMMTDPSAIPRFQREAKAAARIRHQNAISVMDFGITSDKIVYLVMEYFEGQSLREVLERQGPLSLERTAYIIEHASTALQVAHDLGIVHRDIKPDNIMVRTTPTGVEEVKVLDFGIAKLKDMSGGTEKLTNAGMVIGTPNYLSPEQCRAAELDARSDIYSLGIVSYELLSGTCPFSAPTPLAVAMMHTTEAPPALGEKVPGLPKAVEDVVLKALAKKPKDRPQTAIEFAEMFTAAAYGIELPPAQTSGTSRLVTGSHAMRVRTGSIRPSTGSFATDTGRQSATHNTSGQQSIPPNMRGATPSGPMAAVSSGSQVAVPSGNLGPAPATTVLSAQAEPARRSLALPIAAAAFVLVAAVSAAAYYFTTNGRQPVVTPPQPPIEQPVEPPAGMVLVPAGSFQMGRDGAADTAESPLHTRTIPAFYIDKNEVTNEQYLEFVKAKNYPPPSHWKDGTFPAGQGDFPVVNVTWSDARAYAEWAQKRLPSEFEWEYAARGTDGRLFPWGNEPRTDAAVSKEIGLKTPQPGGSMPAGVSPFGVFDMYGNVWEWCENTFIPYPNSPYNMKETDKGLKMLRGGSFSSEQSGRDEVTLTTRTAKEPDYKDPKLGFRCAKSVE
jgi:eukaryotic-like serine/threonine-protein kinase